MKREYAGAAKTTALTGAITAATTTINVTDATGWPTGAVGPFVVTIDAGVTTEEKVLCSGRTGNSLAVQARGFDGTAASDHANAAVVQHTLSATDLREANDHVNDTTGDPHPQYLTASEGAALYPTIGHTHPAQVIPAKTIRVAHAVSHHGTIGNLTRLTCFIAVPPSQTATLVKVRYYAENGTVTFNLQHGLGGGITTNSATGLVATSPPTTNDLTDLALADDTILSAVVTTVTGSPSHWAVAFYVDYTI